MDYILTHIGTLVGITSSSDQPKRGASMAGVESMEDAYLLVRNGRIESFGPMSERPDVEVEEADLGGRMVLPAYVDSHTHLVFAQGRSREFKMRLEGRSYQEIAAAGGGILNSASSLTGMPEDELYDQAFERIKRVIRSGTGSIEIKSGYGLDLDSELKMLRVIRRLKETAGIPVKATFLGAHALPKNFKDDRSGYVDLVCDQMLPAIAAEGLADYIDLFCETGYFDLQDMTRILESGKKHGLKAKVHVNQFSSFGAVPLACKLGALSVDHLEVMEETDIKALKDSHTLAVGLPLCSLFLNIPYAPLRRLIDEHIAVVIASDFNPGSAPSHHLSLAFNLACTQMGLLPEEAFNALTYNAAFALQLQHEVGSIQQGKRANLMVCQPHIKALEDIPYWMGQDLVETMLIG